MKPFSLTPPPDAVNTSVPAPHARLPERTGQTLLALAEIISLLLLLLLGPSRRNRGGLADGDGEVALVDPARVRRYYENFRVESLGMVSAAFADGRRERAVLTDFHNRAQACLLRHWHGKMTPEEYAYELSLLLVAPEKHGQTHQDQNLVLPHRISEKLRNRDLAFGAVLHLLSQKLRPATRALLLPLGRPEQTRSLNMLATVLVALSESDRSDPARWNFASVYEHRAQVRALANGEPGSVRVRDADLEALAEALEGYAEVSELCRRQAGLASAQAEKVLRSTGLLGVFLVERLRLAGAPQITARNRCLARQVLRQLPEVAGLAQNLTHGTRNAIVERTQALFATLRRVK